MNEIRHTVWVNENLYLVLVSAEWYDTASPWRYCAAKLTELLELAQSQTIQIESDGEIDTIDSPTALIEWVAQVFEREHPQGFARMLQHNQDSYFQKQ